MGPVFPFLTALTPTLTATILILNLLKEIFQMVTECKDYFRSFENVGDLIVFVLVAVCQYYYYSTGKIINGYYFPDTESYFEEYLLFTILMLHLNLILQHMIAFEVKRKYVIMII